jgi:hypothetical protein
MLKNSQTKVIMPALAFGVLRVFLTTGSKVFTDSGVRTAYES